MGEVLRYGVKGERQAFEERNEYTFWQRTERIARRRICQRHIGPPILEFARDRRYCNE